MKHLTEDESRALILAVKLEPNAHVAQCDECRNLVEYGRNRPMVRYLHEHGEKKFFELMCKISKDLGRQ